MDLNLYLGCCNASFDLHMDLGRDLSLGPAPLDGATEPNNSHESRGGQVLYPIALAPPMGGIAGSTANEEIFSGLDPSSPSQGSPSERFLSFSNPPPPFFTYTPMFNTLLMGGYDGPSMDEFPNIRPDPLLAGQPALVVSESHAPPMSPFEVVAPPVEAHGEATVVQQQPTVEPTSSIFTRNEIPSSVSNIMRTPQLRFRALIEYESNRQESARRHRTPVDFASESPNPDGSSILIDTIANRLPNVAGNEKLNVIDVGKETTGSLVEDKSGTFNFECNICLDMAKEPVVTSCGHLFCWPCLYQWLHLHSVNRECPVCKGEVDTNITPIYGRGSPEADKEGTCVVGEDGPLKIPPRPRGRRFESLRQQFQRSDPHLQAEALSRPWRRNIGDWRNIATFDDGNWRFRLLSGNTTPNERIDIIHRRLRARRTRRVSDSLNFNTHAAMMELPTALVTDPPVENASSTNQGPMHHFRSSHVNLRMERQSTMHNEGAADSSSVDGRISALSTSPSHPGNSESAVLRNQQHNLRFGIRPPLTSNFVDQASASSPLSLREDDVGATGDALIEPDSAGSSRLFQRRRWTEASGSLDLDGEFSPACKRRRLN